MFVHLQLISAVGQVPDVKMPDIAGTPIDVSNGSWLGETLCPQNNVMTRMRFQADTCRAISAAPTRCTFFKFGV